jgi:hypothetical protein
MCRLLADAVRARCCGLGCSARVRTWRSAQASTYVCASFTSPSNMSSSEGYRSTCARRPNRTRTQWTRPRAPAAAMRIMPRLSIALRAHSHHVWVCALMCVCAGTTRGAAGSAPVMVARSAHSALASSTLSAASEDVMASSVAAAFSRSWVSTYGYAGAEGESRGRARVKARRQAAGLLFVECTQHTDAGCVRARQRSALELCVGAAHWHRWCLCS